MISELSKRKDESDRSPRQILHHHHRIEISRVDCRIDAEEQADPIWKPEWEWKDERPDRQAQRHEPGDDRDSRRGLAAESAGDG